MNGQVIKIWSQLPDPKTIVTDNVSVPYVDCNGHLLILRFKKEMIQGKIAWAFPFDFRRNNL
jgi:hypothetical protein